MSDVEFGKGRSWLCFNYGADLCGNLLGCPPIQVPACAQAAHREYLVLCNLLTVCDTHSMSVDLWAAARRQVAEFEQKSSELAHILSAEKSALEAVEREVKQLERGGARFGEALLSAASFSRFIVHCCWCRPRRSYETQI
jgi:hypothetical protein